VLDALASALEKKIQRTFTEDPKGLLESRKAGCFPPAGAFQVDATLPANEQQQLQALKDNIVEQSTYFRLHTWVTIGTTRFALYSLLQRQNAQVSLVYRTFGTE
jgi:hypothetical protein